MPTAKFIDTHCHLDGEEFRDDLDAVVQRAQDTGCAKVFIPAIDLPSCQTVMEVARRYPGYAYPMLGLHPEEVRGDWRNVLHQIREYVGMGVREYGGTGVRGYEKCSAGNSNLAPSYPRTLVPSETIAIGEVGLDFYWSREFEQEQMLAFEEQVRWSVETRLPLMIHCRKAQNEMVTILKRYARELPGGVFHCFTGNEQEARQLLEFDRFVLGIGGVLTFKKSHLPEVLPASVPLDRIVLETDAPYMAPVPMRGQRNEPAFICHVITRLAEAYGVSEEEVCERTNENVVRIFSL
ncbi:MAG: TatD family hydrolase [Prevotella sp.]|nr:TatD family hydrolase [Prevotella sp.]